MTIKIKNSHLTYIMYNIHIRNNTIKNLPKSHDRKIQRIERY